MRVLAFSDLHLSRRHARALVEASGEADLVIGAGDFCHVREGLDEAMSLLEGVPAPMVVVPGNSETAEELRAAALSGTTVLHGDGVEVEGLRLFGLGGGIPVTPFGDWSFDLTENQAAEMLDRCTGADLLITHSPPKGIADVTSRGASVGSTAIRDAIARLQPALAVCGHVHDCWGQEGRIGDSRVVNLGPGPNWFNL
ncbi:Predicted phosphoesterase [Mameliella alba]|uniref:metallophosphoesterase family protein n=1 Tax=Mameliella alba TaxID=561184 RepID=UPI00087F5029|nr:metallophosphoesterase family protein [Mameliella alba]OWV46753.1 serine/threonine protein phosphatase [Mameliella alba]PTR37666.1 Icc-related predicted phosphoesterase [Mameliella alba]GGF50006.1 serine/threonine protein phosphatase [Mameliella alba]SDD64687.1 Predicted phosphoesterase [Mameliella alba]